MSLLIPLTAWMGCFFESTQPMFVTVDVTQNQGELILLDQVPAEGPPDSAVKLYLPGLYPNLGVETEAEDHYSAVKVLDHNSNQVVQYALTTQRFKRWSPKQEMQWNYFRLQTSFFFPLWLPDTGGVGEDTKELYRRIAVNDPFTRYVDSSGAQQEKDRLLTTRTAAMGLRLELDETGDSIIVRQSVVGGPAYLAGIRNRMRILKVGDSSVVGDSALIRFSAFTKGDSGTAVSLTLYTEGVIRIVTVIKEPVNFPSILIDSIGNIPVVSLFVFADSTVSGHSTATEFREALNDIRQYPVFVLDLRQDPGGSLSQSLQVADELLGADSLIIRQEQRFFDEKYRVPLFGAQDQRATSKGVGTNRKVVLLADSGTASAAEILIAGLRDNLKAPLVGTRTYGKGIGQIVLTTPGGGLALITHLHFRAPKGEDYHGKGLFPDYPVTGGGTQFLAQAVEVAHSLVGDGPLAKRGAAAKKRRQDAERIEANRVERRYLSAGTIEFQ